MKSNNNIWRTICNKDQKYSMINTKCTVEVGYNMSERSPLLANMENLSLGSPKRHKSKTEENSNTSETIFVEENSDKNGTSTIKEKDALHCEKELSEHENFSIELQTGDEVSEECHGTKLKPPIPSVRSSQWHTVDFEHNEQKLDIVRKMSEPSGLSGSFVPWQKIGLYQTLKLKTCQRLYAASGRAEDLALFYHNGRFYAMDAWCSHMGGPLFEGDIEDYNGACHVMCPWHSFMFDLVTGKNDLGLQQKIHELKYLNGTLCVRYHTELTTEPLPSWKMSDITKPLFVKTTANSPTCEEEKTRKTSVLEEPFTL